MHLGGCAMCGVRMTAGCSQVAGMRSYNKEPPLFACS